MKTLSTSYIPLSNQVSQCITRIAEIELPKGLWGELVDILLVNATSNTTTLDLLRGTVYCLGLICEQIDKHTLATHCDSIFTVIIQGLRNEQVIIKQESARALKYALQFSSAIFTRESERNFVMKVLFETCNNPDESIRASALDCFTEIEILYYELLDKYIQEILNTTYNIICNDVEIVAIRAVEFWSKLCEIEKKLLWEHLKAEESNEIPSTKFHRFIEGAKDFLVELMCKAILRSNISDIGEWNLSKAASSCIGLMAELLGDSILGHIIPFVQASIQNQDTKNRETACLVLGSVVYGPSPEVFYEFGTYISPFLYSMTQDENVIIRETSMWTIARFAKYHFQVLLNTFEQFMELMSISLRDDPRVACFSCWALDEFAENCGQLEDNPLESLTKDIINTLISVADRHDASENNLRILAYDAIGTIILNTRNQDDNYIDLAYFFIERLISIANSGSVSSNDDERLMLSCIFHLVVVLESKSDIFAETLVNIILKYLEHPSSNVLDEALMVLNRLAIMSPSYVENQIENIVPHLFNLIDDVSTIDTFDLAISALGNLARINIDKLECFGDGIIDIPIASIYKEDINLQSISKVLVTLGDIALSLRGQFLKHHTKVLGVLELAYKISVEISLTETNYENYEVYTALRQAILDLFTGVTLSLRDFEHSIVSYAKPLLSLLKLYISDKPTETIIATSLALIGDLAKTVGPRLLEVDWEAEFSPMINHYESSDDPTIVDNAKYAKKRIRDLKNIQKGW